MQSVVVLLLVVALAAMSVAADVVVKSVVVLVMLHGMLVLLVVVVAAMSFLCHVHLHRLRRVESHVVAGMVSRVRMVLCLGLGLAVGRSLVD